MADSGSRVIPLAALNAMDRQSFLAAFGDIAEKSQWVALRAHACLPFANKDACISAFQCAITRSSPDMQLALLRAHPDLAGRAAIQGDITDDSKAGAGLDSLIHSEMVTFTQLNDDYKAKFAFPFILAVKDILDAYAKRVTCTREEEFLTAITQVLRIVRFRLEARVAADSKI